MSRLPHSGVYVRLKRSPKHGIGVFAVREIPKGMPLFPYDNQPMEWVHKKKIVGLPAPLKRLYKDFAVVKGDLYGSPKSFALLTPAWYLNESKYPNVKAGRGYRFYALRKIKPNEELTVDYNSYSEKPQLSKRELAASRRKPKMRRFLSEFKLKKTKTPVRARKD